MAEPMGGRSLVLDAWLTAQPEDAFKLLKQYPDTHMVATPVSKRVNTPKNNESICRWVGNRNPSFE